MNITDKFIELARETVIIAEEVTEEFRLDKDDTIDIQFICFEAMLQAIEERTGKESEGLNDYVKHHVCNIALDYITLLKLKGTADIGFLLRDKILHDCKSINNELRRS